MSDKRPWLYDTVLPLFLLAGLTAMFWLTDLDIQIMSRFYVTGAGWTHAEQPLWPFLYDYGTIPAQLTQWAALALLLASIRIHRLKRYRRAAWFVVLVMVVGPGLLVNTTFKQNWGRPRPLDVRQFEGEKTFRHAWVKGPAGDGESFPSGHAAMGFFWLTPFFLLWRRRRKLAVFFLLFGLGYGLLMGLGRMIQGSHFPSDVLWAFGFVYLTGLVFSRLLKPDRALEPSASQPAPRHSPCT